MKQEEWLPVPSPEREGEIIKIKLGGKTLCVVIIAGQLYATASRCPHAGADLSNGWCEGRKLVCSYHRHRFDLETGRGDPGQGDYVKVYPVKKEQGQWYVRVQNPWWRRLFK